MTPKERWLAAIRMQPVDRLPFWPKLDMAYPRAQAARFRDMSVDAIHDWIGSDKHVGLPACVKEVRRDSSVETTEAKGVRRTLYRTRYGEMEQVRRFDPVSQSWHPMTFPVRTVEDIKRMTAFWADCAVDFDAGALEKARTQSRQIAQGAVTASWIGESPLMHWIEWVAGIENAQYLLNDYPQGVAELFAAMHRVLERKAEILAERSPSDVLYMNENTSTTLISPAQYRRYCFAHIGDYARIVRERGGLLILHMCGLLKDLLPDLAQLPVAAFEAFTSPTLGNTTLLDGRTACPDKCLIGGTNAMLWTLSADRIIAKIEEDLDALPHHRGIVVTSAGVMPPMCEPETIREVCEWVKAYPARM